MEGLIQLGNWIIANASMLIGVIMPPVVDYLNKDVRTDRERFLVSIFACFVAALLLHWQQIYDNPGQLLATAGIIFTECQVVFKVYFKDAWLRWRLMELYTKEDKDGEVG